MTACRSNLKNLATALEMYASDHGGRYPIHLDDLPGKYLKELPTCPAARSLTYTNYRAHSHPDCFTVCCFGDNHAKAYAGFGRDSHNFPRYSAEQGLVDHP